MREGLRLLEQCQQEDKARIDWLRGAVKQGLDEIERGEGIAFASIDDLADEISAIGEEASKELSAGSVRGSDRADVAQVRKTVACYRKRYPGLPRLRRVEDGAQRGGR